METKVSEKKYELRALNATDIFAFVAIIKKIGIKNFKNCFSTEDIKNLKEAKGNEEEIGMAVVIEVADVIISNLQECENEMYNFLSRLSGLKIATIKELPPATFMDMIVDIIKKPEFDDFFKAASRLFK